MAFNVDLFTIGGMRQAQITAFAGEAAGHETERAFNNHLHDYWQGNNSGPHTIDIDMQEAVGFNGLLLFMMDYDTDHNYSGNDVDLYYSDNGSTYTSYIVGNLNHDVGWPLLSAGGQGSLQTHRYWRIVLDGITSLPKISRFYLVRKYSLSLREVYPVTDQYHYHNIEKPGPGQSRSVRGQRNLSQARRPRQYVMNSISDWETLRDAFDDCQGQLYPLVMATDDGWVFGKINMEVVRFGSDILDPFEKANVDRYEPKVTFITEPFIADGFRI